MQYTKPTSTSEGLKRYAQSLETSSTPPLITDEAGAIFLLSTIGKIHITELGELKTGDIPNVFIYTKEEDKKEFSITRVRDCLGDMSLAPYSGKNIYILKEFDNASIEAQNAFLKGLEDMPSYACIILVVSNEESLLETIHSRSILLKIGTQEQENIPQAVQEKVQAFFSGEPLDFIGYIFGEKFEKQSAIAILSYALGYDTKNDPLIYEKAIEEIFSTNENPRNILERVFLCEIAL